MANSKDASGSVLPPKFDGCPNPTTRYGQCCEDMLLLLQEILGVLRQIHADCCDAKHIEK